MPLPKSVRSFAQCALAALLILSLSACMSLGGQRWKQRVENCQQDRAPIPDWPESYFEAYAIELLGVIRDDRMAERRERECVRDLD